MHGVSNFTYPPAQEEGLVRPPSRNRVKTFAHFALPDDADWITNEILYIYLNI